MLHKLDFLVRFWELKARHALLGEPLGAAEQVELLSLLQLVTGDLDVPAAGPAPRSRDALPIQVIGDGAIVGAELRNVSAGALLVACAAAMQTGSGVVVRVTDAVSGVEFAIPCTVIWTHDGKPNTMALAVDGIPTRNQFIAPQRVQNTSFGMGARARLLG
jgi:hypothetical protein